MSDFVDVKLIDGTARTVNELFTGRKYGLDYYQREYTWTEANVSELLSDLSNAFIHEYEEGDERKRVASYRPYFLGPLVTSSVGGTRFLVDGQQRLTTLSLLLIHLDHLVEGVDGAQSLSALVYSSRFGSLSFNIDVPERDHVMRAILDGVEFDTTGANESVANIWSRYLDIVELFPEELKGAPLLHFVDWLLERVVLVEIGTTDQDMALEIFETMNDRGLRLSNTDMLKGFLLARMEEPAAIDAANQLWRTRVGELSTLDKNADAEFLKAWLRGKYADTIRERKKDASPRDFDLIGTAFHKWVRDNAEQIGLRKASEFQGFVNRDFDRMSRRYRQLIKASTTFTPGLEPLFHNAVNGFTLQFMPIMAAVTPDDDEATFAGKARLIASFLDIFLARRMVNFRNYGYSTVVYTMFNLTKDLRDRGLDEVRDILADRVADLPETFDGVRTYFLTQRNRSHIAYLLARITSWIEAECSTGHGFPEYVDRSRRDPYEVEHLWANHPQRHTAEFPNAYDFDAYRNRFGGLVLLPKSFNASYGDKMFTDKVPHYFGQNLLAASLAPLAYENNPAFRTFRDRTGLEFKAYPDGFTKSDLDERQDLYRKLCEHVWSPERIGLGGGTPSASTTSDERRAFYGVALADLIEAGLLTAGDRLIGERNNRRHEVVINDDGNLKHANGSVFKTLSGAADSLTGASNNGWAFWSVTTDNQSIPLLDLRANLLAARQQ